jgi:hypothetical protein
MKHIFITTGALPQPAPDFETLSPHPRIAGARVLPADGRVSIAGEEWTIRGARAVFLMNDQPFPVDYTGAEIIVIAPVQIVTDCTFSISVAGVLRIEESDGPPVVLTAFGRAKIGEA